MHTERTHLALKGKGIAIALTATLATVGLGFGAAAPLGQALAEEAAQQDQAAAESAAPTTGAVTTTTEVPALDAGAQQDQAAAEEQTVQTTDAVVSLTDLSSTAAQMYDAINQARAQQGLQALTRDANLEAAAWQRAAEESVLYAPVRPDGAAFTTTASNMAVEGQAMASGTQEQAGTAEAALALMQADAASAQALASTTATTVGAALVQDATGALYWSVVLSPDASTAEASGTDAVDGAHDYTVALPSANVSASANESVNLTLAPGSTKQLYPVAHASGQLDADGVQYAFNTAANLGVTSTATWESSAPSVVSVDGNGKLTVVSSGTAVVSAKTSTGTTTWSVTVSDAQTSTEQATETDAAAVDDAAGEQTADADTGAGTDEQTAGTQSSAATAQDASAQQGTTSQQENSAKVDLADCTVVGLTDLGLDETGNVAQPTFSVTAPDGTTTVSADEYTTEFTYDDSTQTGTLVLTAKHESQTLTGTVTKELGLSQEARDALAAAQQEAAAQQDAAAQQEETAAEEQAATAEPDAGQSAQGRSEQADAAKTDISAATVTLDGSNYPYTGSPVAPKPTVTLGQDTLSEGTDYTLSYTDNVEPGLVTITITGVGDYTGTRTTTFNIVQNGKSTLADAGFSVAPIDDQQFTGAAVTPSVSVSNGSTTLTQGSDYTLSYSDNINAGTATVTATAAEGSDYIGSVSATFTIAPVAMSALRIEMPNQYYTGLALQPSPASVTTLKGFVLTQGTDYDVVSYRDNVEVGTAYVTLQGKGNFTGTVEAAFKVLEASAADTTDASAAADKAGVSTTLPATGDGTSALPVVAGAAAGAALIAGGVLLAARRRVERR